MRNFYNSLEVRDIVSRIADTLEIYSFSLLVNELLELFGVIAIHEVGIDAQTWEKDFQLIVRAAVEVGSSNDVVPSLCERADGHELCGLT